MKLIDVRKNSRLTKNQARKIKVSKAKAQTLRFANIRGHIMNLFSKAKVNDELLVQRRLLSKLSNWQLIQYNRACRKAGVTHLDNDKIREYLTLKKPT